MRLAPLIFLVGLGACAPFPQLDGTISDAAQNAPYPQLAALRPILMQAEDLGTSSASAEFSNASIDARIVALNARAARLRAPVIDRVTRARMSRGVDTSALR